METLLSLQKHLPPFAFDLIRLTNGLILLLVLFVPFEHLFALRRSQKVLRKGFGTDLGYYFLSSMLPNRVLAVPLAALALGLQRMGSESLQLWVGDFPVWLRFAAAMVVAEIGFYWGHRWMHQSDLLWRFHSIHHSATEMDWLVNTRAHPVDLVFTRLCGYIPMYALGLAHSVGGGVDWIPLVVALTGSIWGYFIHSNTRVRLGWLEHAIATPMFHHWHHNHEEAMDAADDGAAHRHGNYAPTMPWVDRLFGTLHSGAGQWPKAYGIDEPTESGLAGQLLQPFLPDRKSAVVRDPE